jgi:hypothetical protein
MRSPLRALKRILVARRLLAQQEQQVLKQMLDGIPDVAPSASRARKLATKMPARRRLVCRRCDRRFALPMHLGRHLATSHKRRAA